MPYIYILESLKNRKYYIGSCENIERRLSQHNVGLVKSTKPFVPWLLIFEEEMSSVELARRRELQIKSWKSRASIEKLVRHF